jgi:hypothetical protein
MIIPTPKPCHHASAIELVDYLEEQRVQMHIVAETQTTSARGIRSSGFGGR